MTTTQPTPVIQMRRFGTHGQWGNQVFQYAFLRTYARRHSIDYEMPPWAGQYFFGHVDPPITTHLPDAHEPSAPTAYTLPFGHPIPPSGPQYHNRNFLGWAQYHTSWYAPDKEFIQPLFCATPEIDGQHRPLLSELRGRGDTLISLHLRRGDSGRLMFFFTPIIWCLEWLHSNWSRFQNPVLFLAIEDASCKKWFSRWNAITIDDLHFPLRNEPYPHYIYPFDIADHQRQLTFFPEWYIMQHSDVVVASESSFSVSAAWVNHCLKEFWRPRLSTQAFEQCDTWNMDASRREQLDDYPGIPGTQIDANPEFAIAWEGFKPKHRSTPETDDMIQHWLDTH